MTMAMTMDLKALAKLFLDGGPVMWPILGLSVVGLAILFWKVLELRAGRRNARGLVVVSTIITAEPMLGILGTVTGIIKTFGALNASAGAADPLAATAGIGEALITTAAGLVAALVLIFPYNVISAKVDGD
ncbi:MAG: MotA/TolQ/ExbB proton channel family protein [Kiritimatiellae bacterium]|nr:MotA/TolQ/ExbB proton channel family protein [Kiritimatiellia bacterium]